MLSFEKSLYWLLIADKTNVSSVWHIISSQTLMIHTFLRFLTLRRNILDTYTPMVRLGIDERTRSVSDDQRSPIRESVCCCSSLNSVTGRNAGPSRPMTSSVTRTAETHSHHTQTSQRKSMCVCVCVRDLTFLLLLVKCGHLYDISMKVMILFINQLTEWIMNTEFISRTPVTHTHHDISVRSMSVEYE